MLWSPHKFVDDPARIPSEMLTAYRRVLLPATIHQLITLVLDRCSIDCRKVDWPPPHERVRDDEYLVISDLNRDCRLQVAVEGTTDCPLLSLKHVAERRMTKRNLQRALLAAQLVLLREDEDLSGDAEFEPLTILETYTGLRDLPRRSS